MTHNDWRRLLREYDAVHRSRHIDGLSWFVEQPSLTEAVKCAAVAIDRRGKRFGDQRRIRKNALAAATSALLHHMDLFAAAKSFDELHEVIVAVLGDIDGIGELYCYDTALRIGAYRRLKPARVYLHAGARQGARALDHRLASAQSVAVIQLPKPLQERPPHEIENILCIYKDRFRGRVGGSSRC